MPVFSASVAKDGTKAFYKDYRRVKVASMFRMEQIARTCSISSYTYGDGVTDGGEHCRGHRAGRSVLAAGDCLLYDFDRGMDLETLTAKLSGVSSFIGPSKGWNEDTPKFHVAVCVDRELPMDPEEFRRWHRAAAQWLGIEGRHDTCMETWTQQLAPPRHDRGPAWFCKEGPLAMDTVLDAYIEPEEIAGSGSGDGVAGVVPDGTEFRDSRTGDWHTVEEMRERLEGTDGKVRVHCIKGIKHDDRADTAFVKAQGDMIYYHCSGGRCGETLILPRDPGFVVEEEEAPRPAAEAPRTLSDWIARAQEMIGHHPDYVRAYTQEATLLDKEQAWAWACCAILYRMDVRLLEGCLHRWDGKVWSPVMQGQNDVSRFVAKVADAARFYGFSSCPIRLPRVAKMVLNQMPAQDRVNVFDALNLQNGVYVMGQGLCKHDRRFGFTSLLPYDYDKDAVCPQWEAFVSRITLGSVDLQKALQDALGYLFLSRFNMEKLICFVGEGANGKSTVSKVLKELVGENNYSAQRLHLLTKSSGEGAYARAMLSGKVINITEELEPKALESAMFKDIISGEDIDARMPYGKPFKLKMAPKHVASTNTTNRLVQERTHGFSRRLHLIPFAYKIPEAERDYDILDKFIAELPGIFNWVLAGALRVRSNRSLTVAPEMATLLTDVERENNPAQQFVEECLDMIELPDDKKEWSKLVVKVGDLYGEYQDYCTENGYYALGRNHFSREMVRLGVTKVRDKYRSGKHVIRVSGFAVKVLPENQRREPGGGPSLRLV